MARFQLWIWIRGVYNGTVRHKRHSRGAATAVMRFNEADTRMIATIFEKVLRPISVDGAT
jgi:hypothetical protein